MRVLSPAARRAIYAQETDEVFLALLLITDVGIEGNAPLRFVNNTENIWSRANGEPEPQEYLAFPFGLTLPDERDDQLLGIRLQIDNVDPRILAAVRPLTRSPRLRFYIILASSPDTVEAGPLEGLLAGYDADAQVISATLRTPEILSEPFPYRTFIPGEWRAVF